MNETQNATQDATQDAAQNASAGNSKWDNAMRTLRKPLTLRNFMVLALMASLYAQLGHTAYVSLHLGRGTDDTAAANAYAFALAVEFSVLLFVMAGHKYISYLFAVATFLTNLSFYWITWEGNWESANAVFAVLMSLLLPGVIVGYSHIIATATAHGDAHNAGAAQTQDAACSTTADATQNAAQTDAIAHAETQPDAEAQTQDAIAQDTQSAAPTIAQPCKRKNAAAQTQDAKLTQAQRRAHIEESGMEDAAQIAAQYAVSIRTAQDDLKAVRSGLVQVNGAAH